MASKRRAPAQQITSSCGSSGAKVSDLGSRAQFLISTTLQSAEIHEGRPSVSSFRWRLQSIGHASSSRL